MGADAGADVGEQICGSRSGFPLYSLIGSDKSHDLESAPCILLPESDWIGRSVTANSRREWMRERILSEISNF